MVARLSAGGRTAAQAAPQGRAASVALMKLLDHVQNAQLFKECWRAMNYLRVTSGAGTERGFSSTMC